MNDRDYGVCGCCPSLTLPHFLVLVNGCLACPACDLMTRWPALDRAFTRLAEDMDVAGGDPL